jgi:hypothetical protein
VDVDLPNQEGRVIATRDGVLFGLVNAKNPEHAHFSVEQLAKGKDRWWVAKEYHQQRSSRSESAAHPTADYGTAATGMESIPWRTGASPAALAEPGALQIRNILI